MSRQLALTLALISCGGAPDVDTTPGSTARSSDEAPVTYPDGLTPEILQGVCDDPCAGPMSQLTLMRDSHGGLQRIVYTGDIDQCSHVTTVWYDVQGRPLLTLDDHPVERDEATRIAERIQAVEDGLTKRERLNCPQAP